MDGEAHHGAQEPSIGNAAPGDMKPERTETRVRPSGGMSRRPAQGYKCQGNAPVRPGPAMKQIRAMLNLASTTR